MRQNQMVAVAYDKIAGQSPTQDKVSVCNPQGPQEMGRPYRV